MALCIDKCTPTLVTLKFNAKRRRRLILSRWCWRWWWWWFILWPHFFLIELNRMEKDEMKPQQCNNGNKTVCTYELVNVKRVAVYLPPMPISIGECAWMCASLYPHLWLAPTREIYITDTVRQVSNFFLPRILCYAHEFSPLRPLFPIRTTSLRWKWYTPNT